MMKTIVIQTRLMPSGRFIAITLFGMVFTRDRRLISPSVLNHELIHCQQQLEWLYIPFYILYIAEWIWLSIKHRNGMTGYRLISFEREAYDNQHDKSYLRHRKPYANYRQG